MGEGVSFFTRGGKTVESSKYRKGGKGRPFYLFVCSHLSLIRGCIIVMCETCQLYIQ